MNWERAVELLLMIGEFMSRLLLLTILMGIVWGGQNPTSADQPFATPAEVTNAALVYWQSFALLPDLSDVEVEQIKMVERGEVDLDASSGILAKSQSAINLAKIVPVEAGCRWELIEDGPGTMLPHLGKARRLATLLAIQARIHSADGESDAAVDCLVTAMLLARNVDEGVLVQLLVGNAIESTVIDSAIAISDQFGAKDRTRLGEAVASLPPRSNVADAMRYEKEVFGVWIRDLVQSETKVASQTLARLGLPQDDVQSIMAGPPETRAKHVNELDQVYDRTILASLLPADEAIGALQDLEEDYQTSKNPLIKNLMPSTLQVFRKHSEIDQKVVGFLANLD